ncbi:cytosolic phospholipase A2 gamma-like [Chanos chanos]|uniref:Cytosolic phospholipase A2 gamma-like n=1 Tax=Chanos chanos TaxID=29144 RepID=A0A6J2WMD3_CHACN|nr:cytosolic phospholipase A2 gamma-like [Chanos chanos]
MPNIALLGSGGGERAMLGLLGSLVQLKKCDLLDCMLYLSGISGSTWCMASLYRESEWSAKLDTVQDAIVKRLNGPEVTWTDSWIKLKKYHKRDNFSLTDFWAVMFVSSIVKEIDEDGVTHQRDYHTKDPYPVYAVIDDQCKRESLDSDAWFEITPHEAGYSLTGAFVDSAYLGSQFKNGTSVKKQPEIDMLYLQGFCGSALADETEIKKWLWEEMKKIISCGEESSQACQVLLTLAELNLCVLKDEDPTSLITTMTELLKGKLDKHGRAMFISAQELLHERKSAILEQFTLTICENFGDWFKVQDTAGWIAIDIVKLITRWIWGTTYDFLYDMEVEDVHPSVLTEKERYYEDAGLLINSPYFPMLREERDIDLIISLDFSAGDPMETVVKTSQMCKELKIPFPGVKLPDNITEPDDFYVFKGCDKTPTVIHIPLFNKVNCDGHIQDWASKYSTFQQAYSPDLISDLIKKAGENVINTKEKILKEIAKIVEQKQSKVH